MFLSVHERCRALQCDCTVAIPPSGIFSGPECSARVQSHLKTRKPRKLSSMSDAVENSGSVSLTAPMKASVSLWV